MPTPCYGLLRTYDRINVIVAGKQPAPQWLSIRDAVTHCDAGIGIWKWPGTEAPNSEPDVVMACAGDVPTLQTLAAVAQGAGHGPRRSNLEYWLPSPLDRRNDRRADP